MPISAKAIYGIINKISDSERFIEFARLWLKLQNHEIDHIKEKYQGQPREQKFQMISRWQMKNGRDATQIKLYEIYNDFAQSSDDTLSVTGSQREDVPSNVRTRTAMPHGNQATSHGTSYMGHPSSEYSAHFTGQFIAGNSSANSGTASMAQPVHRPTADNSNMRTRTAMPHGNQATSHGTSYKGHPSSEYSAHFTGQSIASNSSANSDTASMAQPLHRPTADNSSINQAASPIHSSQPTAINILVCAPTDDATHQFTGVRGAGSYSSQPAAINSFSGAPMRAIHQFAGPSSVVGPIPTYSPVSEVENPCMEVHSIHVHPCTQEKNDQIRRENDNIYPMQHSRGLVVIINNNFQGEKKERRGAKEDVRHLKELWQQLGCEVEVKQDRTCDQMLEILENAALHQTEKYNYLAIFVMSHGGMQGDTEVIRGSDGSCLSVKNILLLFKNEESPNWVGIPKLFFFQFCRGTNVDEGIDGLENVFSSLHYCSTDLEQQDNIRGGQRQSHCAYSDMFISYATLPGYAALRNGKGSWFINAVTNVFMKFAWKEHLNELMLRVRRGVSERTGYIEIEAGPRVTCKEMSESVDRLRSKLFLLLTLQPSS